MLYKKEQIQARTESWIPTTRRRIIPLVERGWIELREIGRPETISSSEALEILKTDSVWNADRDLYLVVTAQGQKERRLEISTRRKLDMLLVVGVPLY